MKLAFSGEAHYPDFTEGYELYKNRARGEAVEIKTYTRIIKAYCKILAERLEENGIVDIPAELGCIAAATLTRRPQFRGKKFVGFGKMDWKAGHYDGNLKTFGLVYMPKRGKYECLRSFGYVANRKLFQRVKGKASEPYCKWAPIEFNANMI